MLRIIYISIRIFFAINLQKILNSNTWTIIIYNLSSYLEATLTSHFHFTCPAAKQSFHTFCLVIFLRLMRDKTH